MTISGATTSNKQLNFLQHVFTILKQHRRTAIVVPDNVLFDGGAGETVCRDLLKQPDVHTLPQTSKQKALNGKTLASTICAPHHFNLKEKTLKRSA